MRSVLCFGDSNTHGQIPGGSPLERFSGPERWPGVLQKKLGAKWHVIEEGLSGRTTIRDDPVEGEFKNGLPDGVVRIEEPGQLPRTRLYKAGVDVGKGDAAKLQSLSFAVNSTVAGTLTP